MQPPAAHPQSSCLLLCRHGKSPLTHCLIGNQSHYCVAICLAYQCNMPKFNLGQGHMGVNAKGSSSHNFYPSTSCHSLYLSHTFFSFSPPLTLMGCTLFISIVYISKSPSPPTHSELFGSEGEDLCIFKGLF